MDAFVVMLLPAALSCLGVLPVVHGHGRLMDPPNRGTMWRFGFDNPRDFQDHELNCGGQKHQWEKMNGRCGLCGDPYDSFPRAHEAGGLYANGIIVDTYEEGSRVDVTLDITAPHKGWFEFRMCPVNNRKVRVTQSCLDRYLLKFSDRQTRFYLPNTMKANVTVEVRLPTGLTCTQCVLQWKYHTGKDWGCDKPDNTNTCCLGCGPQEEFYGCADVAIVKRGVVLPTTRPTIRTTRRIIPTTRPTIGTTRRRVATTRPTIRTTRRRVPTTRATIRTVRPTFRTTSRPFPTFRTTRRRPVTARTTTTRRTTTPRRTFIWQKSTTGRKTYPTRAPTTKYTSKHKGWWNGPTTKPYTLRPTTRSPQEGKYPTWKWKINSTVKTATTKKYWWQSG